MPILNSNQKNKEIQEILTRNYPANQNKPKSQIMFHKTALCTTYINGCSCFCWPCVCHWLDRRQGWKKPKTIAFLTGILKRILMSVCFSVWKYNSLFSTSSAGFPVWIADSVKIFTEFRSRFWNWNSGQKCSRLWSLWLGQT